MIAIYQRLIPRAKQDDRAALEQERLVLNDWALAQPDEVRWYSDDPESKEGWLQMIDDLNAGLIHKVVVYSFDRLFKPVTHLTDWLTQLHVNHIPLVVVEHGLDTTSPEGQRFLELLDAVAHADRLARSHRQATGLNGQVEKQIKTFPAGAVTPARIAPDKEAKIIQQYKEGHTIRKIAKDNGTCRQTVYAIARRQGIYQLRPPYARPQKRTLNK